MEIAQIFQELHKSGISNMQISNYLGISPASVTMIAQGKRSGEKYTQKLLILLEQQKVKFESLKVYETERNERSLDRVLMKSEWDIAHEQSKDRIQELNESAKWIKEWTQELRAACKVLGIRYPRGYKPDGNEKEQEIVRKAHEKKLQIEYSRQLIGLEMSDLKRQVISSYIIPKERENPRLSHSFPIALPSPSTGCARCGEDVRQSGSYRTGPDGKDYCNRCFNLCFPQ